MTASHYDSTPTTVVGYSANNWDCALTVLRITGPLRACGLQFIEGNDTTRIFPERVSLADVVVIQRDFPYHTDAYERIISQAHAEGKPVIFEIDDLLFELPADHPDQRRHYYDDSLVPMLRALMEADAVTVSSAPLRAYCNGLNLNTWVLPNYLNDRIWQMRKPQDQTINSPQRPVVIGYMGGDGHLPDLEMVAPALRNIVNRYGDRIALHFMGGRPPALLIDDSVQCRVEWTPMDAAHYARFVSHFSQIQCDIFIAPLSDNLHARCKSPIKFLEYSAYGSPGVYSNVSPYADIVNHGETGFLANTLDDWETYLCALVDDQKLRLNIGMNAQRIVGQDWLLSAHAHQWLDLYQQVAAMRSHAHQDTVAVRAIRQVQVWQKRGALLKPDQEQGTLTRDTSSVQMIITQQNAYIASLQGQLSTKENELAASVSKTALLYAQGQQQIAENEKAVTLLKVQNAEKDACLSLLNSEVALRNQHISALSQHIAQQTTIINGLLNGRVMKLMLNTQKGLKRLLLPRNPPPPYPTVGPPPAAPVSIAPNGIDPAKQAEQYKQSLTQLYTSALKSFLASGQKLVFPVHEKPVVSVLLPMNNRAELSLQCLRLLTNNSSEPFEVIIFDNASSDDTGLLLEKIEGVKIIRNSTNLNYLVGTNQAAKFARGEYLLFFNNDVQLLPGAIDSALKTIRNSDDIGAVGSKIILLDGNLQEAGSIVWKDGTCSGYGRGESPLAPQFMYQRDVDYCSGAFLLTPRVCFEQLGGFDEAYRPAYYEETDYCLSLWQMGKRVVYDPNVVVLHYESAAYQFGRSSAPTQMQIRNRATLVKKHAELLKSHYLPTQTDNLYARSFPTNAKRVLFIDDRVPHTFLGSGFPRSRELLLALLDSGCQVTFYPSTTPSETWDSVYEDIPRTVEVSLDFGVEKLEQFLGQRKGYYDMILVSRPHNAKFLRPILAQHPEWFSKTKLIYDAEAIYAYRSIAQRRLNGETISANEADALVREEVDLAQGADSIICVSDTERTQFLSAGFSHVYTLSHAVAVLPTQNSFADRSGILFVGMIHDDETPNAHAVYWFGKYVLPLLQEQLGLPLKFTVAGVNNSEKVRSLASETIHFVGKADDLMPLYNQARAFVAPSRFGAGIPIKMIDAAAHGVPIICTSLLADQLNWQPEVEVLVGDDPCTFAEQCARLYTDGTLWTALRQNALKRVEQECSPQAFRSAIKRITNDMGAR